MKSLLLVALLPVMTTAITKTAEQDLDGNDQVKSGRANSDWRCGHTRGIKVREDNSIPEDNEENNARLVNPNAGIVLLRDGSLNYIRDSENKFGDELRERLNLDTQNLFCGPYISRYRNPDANGTGGVCIRDIREGNQWDSILQADREVKELHAYFATQNGFQKSVKSEKTPSTPDYNAMWGSGRSGTSPDNWCHNYMKEMLCHIAFPQWAGNLAELVSNPTPPNGHLVRPVSRSTCDTLMDNCNRREPDPLNQVLPWIERFFPSDAEEDLSNSFYCDAWNRGLNISQAGTGVGAGADESEEKYTAQWDASSSLSPLGLVAVLLSVLATVL